MTSPLRDAFRPTTTLVGPSSVTSVRHAVLIGLCWALWYLAAGYALDAIVSRLAPDPAPAMLP